jgi:hypothetical protein
MSSLSAGHGRHLLGAHRALTRQLEEIERAAVHGRAPGGQALTPLPPELWAQIGPALAHIGALTEQIARRHAPDSFHAADARQPVGVTLRWMSLLVSRLEEALEDLDPTSIERKFGPFSEPDEAERMASEVAALRAELAAAQTALANWREGEP